MKNNFYYLIIAVLLSTLFFLFLPASYYFFHQNIYKLMKIEKNNILTIDTISLKKKEKEKEKLKEMPKPKTRGPERKIKSRFSLDLGVLAGADSGAASINKSDLDKVIEEGEADIPPIRKNAYSPRYPEQAKREGIEGLVVAKVLIDENGDVLTVRIIEAPDYFGFDISVKNALKRWKFKPALLNNMPVRVWATQSINFKL